MSAQDKIAAPDRIWAEADDDDMQCGAWGDHSAAFDWADDPVEYVRADLAAAETARADRAEAELAAMRSEGSWYREIDIDKMQDRIEKAEAEIARLTAERDAAWAAGAEAMREGAACKTMSFLVGDPMKGVPLRTPMTHEIADAIHALPLPLPARPAPEDEE